MSDQSATKLERIHFNEVDLTRILYHLFIQDKIALDKEDGLIDFIPEFYNSDICRIILRLGPEEERITVKYQLIEVKYNDNSIKNTIDQIIKRETDFRKVIIPGWQERQKEDLKKKDLDRVLNIEYIVESMLFHNNPSEQIIQACKQNNIRVFQYDVPPSYIKEL